MAAQSINPRVVGAALDNSTGSFLDANGGLGSVQYGLNVHADSLGMNGQGATAQFASLVNTASADTATFHNYATGGDNAADMSYRVFLDENPGDTGDPAGIIQIGTNNAKLGSITTADQQNYQEQLAAASTWFAMSSSDKILAGNGLVTATGTWAADTTFATANALQSTTNGNTLSLTNIVGMNGVFYVWFSTSNSSGGLFQVSVDGTTATNTWTGSTTVSNVFSTFTGPANVSGLHIPQVARYVTTPGQHTITLTDISATNAANTVDVIGFGFPRSLRYRPATGPKVAIGGTPYQAANAQATYTATYDLWNREVAMQDIADGLNTPFVNIRAALDYNCDFLYPSAIRNCPATLSGGPPYHWNQAAAYRVAAMYEAALSLNAPAFSGMLNSNLGMNGTALVIFGASNTDTIGLTNNGTVIAANNTSAAIPALVALQQNASAVADTFRCQNSVGVVCGFTIQGLPYGKIGTAIASAATIAPVSQLTHITGTTQITTITPPTGCTTSGFGCLITLMPDGLWSTGTSGNIALASTAVVSKALIMTYDPATSKWYPSY